MVLYTVSNLFSHSKTSFSFINAIFKCGVYRVSVPSYNINTPRLSPAEVNRILTKLEYTQEFAPGGPIKSFDTNQLRSNDPMEDMRAEAISLHDGGFYAGVFDGHVSPACAQVLAKRMFHYVDATLLPKDKLKSIIEQKDLNLVKNFNDNYEFVTELKEKYEKSLLRHMDILSNKEIMSTKDAIEYALLKLDDDLSSEGVQENGEVDRKGMTVCMAGAVACLAYIKESELYLASVGDCQAVVGVLNDSKTWTANKLNVAHNSDCPAEVERILSEHPPSESDTVISSERLLGQLAPLRAFGDVRYKWSAQKLKKLAVPLFGSSAIPPNYYTPPYLTAKPDITYHRITPKDKFLVIASDGLWELLSPLEVVRMVGEHMGGKAALTPIRIPKDKKLKEINSILLARREGLNNVPEDRNAATHLIRNALGGTDIGVEHSRISFFLSFPQDVVRYYRDDISITVVYFDSEYISQNLYM